MPADLLEKLGALGYVSTPGTTCPAPSGADPKDKIEEYQTVNTLMREGLVALREGRFAASLSRFQRSSRAASTASRRTTTRRARWWGSSNGARPPPQYEGRLQKLPAYTAAYVGLAEAHLAAGHAGPALEAVRRGLKVAPDDPRLIEIDGDMARRRGEAGAAVRRLPARGRARASGRARSA